MSQRLTNHALQLTFGALLGLVVFVTPAFADSFTATLADPTTFTSSPASCSVWFLCTFTLKGSQSSKPGGSGSYTAVDVFSSPPYQTGPQTYCIDLAKGSNIQLNFAAGYLGMATDGHLCGPQVSDTQFTFSGPYTISGADTPFKGATGSGTVTLTFSGDDGSHHNIRLNGTITLPAGGGGGGGGGFAATPELDSLTLFGLGFGGVVSYALLRARARRRSE